MSILGVDPGINGGYAVLSADKKQCHETGFLPIVPRKKRGNRISPHHFLRLLGRIQHMFNPRVVLIEQSNPMPGQGVTSVFQYGRAYGSVEALLATLDVPIYKVTPQSWKKTAGLLKAPKGASLSKAIDLFPESVEDFSRKKDEHRAEAALIAYYGKGE